MASAADGGSAGDVGGGGNVNIFPLLRTLAKGAAVTLGGIFSITAISSTTVALFTQIKKGQIGSSSPPSSSSPSSSIVEKNAISCNVCRAKGFYMCKLCKGNAIIEWSPLYDPVFINPCLCPTCDGHRIQRCLNCLGSGFIQQVKGTSWTKKIRDLEMVVRKNVGVIDCFIIETVGVREIWRTNTEFTKVVYYLFSYLFICM